MVASRQISGDFCDVGCCCCFILIGDLSFIAFRGHRLPPRELSRILDSFYILSPVHRSIIHNTFILTFLGSHLTGSATVFIRLLFFYLQTFFTFIFFPFLSIILFHNKEVVSSTLWSIPAIASCIAAVAADTALYNILIVFLIQLRKFFCIETLRSIFKNIMAKTFP